MGLQIWIPGSITDTDTGVPGHHWSPHSKIINHSYLSVAGLSQDIILTCGLFFSYAHALLLNIPVNSCPYTHGFNPYLSAHEEHTHR